MKHVSALLVKFIIVTAIIEVILNMQTYLTFTDILYIALAVTVPGYIIGDLLILPASNNTIAAVADFCLALVTIYMFNSLWNISEISINSALISAVVLGVGEWIFHKYLASNVLPNRKEG